MNVLIERNCKTTIYQYNLNKMLCNVLSGLREK